MFTAYFNALTLINDKKFNSLLTMQVSGNRHFDGCHSANYDQLSQIDTSQFNVIFFQLTDTPEPAHIVQLIELSKQKKLVIIADDAQLANLAFEIGAVDFLITKSPSSRIRQCFEKLVHLCPLASTMEHNYQNSNARNHLIIKDVGKVRLIEIDDIIWINGAGNYVELHFWEHDKVVLHRETIKKLEQQLAPAGFIRIHRSTLVKQRAVSELAATESGDYKITLKNSVQLNLSRRYKNSLTSILERT
ncbi:LytTR family DNA-binding domain-containing protein [Pseudoalteromonas haloplanktis]|uniref:LytTR family DNA-binding domain-containing protein n=1 Tax=Pseudoalteromonas haloplanktis TaxID=228 RepID=A0ABU1BCC4_PSEHA|nr:MULTISPECIES: LytTR family DNA-binding domain-containing protein [Pseudoalteromonas]MDQ9092133.1 LytTR family DNA-binding domain-containing protein [Pseudoalteromonas haloplanktis]BDF96076.1 hypothetical protein KAN5_29140 [Pseudoalteromonas sp. KAN5]